MTEIELTVPTGEVVASFEAVAHAAGLSIHRGSLSKYKGSTHWHLTKPGERGTLEATWWPDNNRLWLAVHANRKAAWQEAAIEAIILALAP
jgi:hypothetical protein